MIFVIKLYPISKNIDIQKIVHKSVSTIQQYIFGLSKMISLLWVMYYIGFSILGVKNALFFAILCGCLEIVPFIGNITGATMTILVAAVNGAPLPVLLGIFAVQVRFFSMALL